MSSVSSDAFEGAAIDQVEQRRFMDRDAEQRVGPAGREAEGDRAPERGPTDVGGFDTEQVDQSRQVIDVVVDASLAGRAGAEAVPAAVVDDDLERITQQGGDAVPDAAVHPRSVHEHERLADAASLVVKLDSVYFGDRHRALAATAAGSRGMLGADCTGAVGQPPRR